MSFNNKQNDQYHPWLGKVENAKEYFKDKEINNQSVIKFLNIKDFKWDSTVTVNF